MKPPAWLNEAGRNLALRAKVEVSSTYSKKYSTKNINDGKYDYSDNYSRWVSGSKTEPFVILKFNSPVTVNALRLITGEKTGAKPIEDFVLQYRKVRGGSWINIEDAVVTGNKRLDVGLRFPEVKASEFRLRVTKTPGGLARIWDIQLYELKK